MLQVMVVYPCDGLYYYIHLCYSTAVASEYSMSCTTHPEQDIMSSGVKSNRENKVFYLKWNGRWTFDIC